MAIKVFQNNVDNFEIFYDAVKQNIEFKETFTTRETTYTMQIIFPEQDVKYTYSFEAPKLQIFGKISKLKSHLSKLPETVFSENGFAPKDIQYYQFSKQVYDLETFSGLFHSFENVIEIDITAAYFYAALQMGVLTEQLFNELLYNCKTVTDKKSKSKRIVFSKDKNGNKILRPKGDRLKILGSMAVRTTETVYLNGEERPELCSVKKDDRLRSLWFAICKRVDDLFQKLVLIVPEKEFLFYFVDGIYLINNPETVSKIKAIFEAEKFPFKEILITDFKVVNKNKRLVIEIKKENGKEKKFIVPHREVKKYYLD